jgi:Tol biopolymer transport system component/TolB-like protein/Tfp pilus assembly protein PilF
MSSAVKHFYRFGGFRLDAVEHLLYRQDGEVVPLKPKVVETLELLVRERGRLITKDELMDSLWPDTIVEESNLSQNIYLLRKVLSAGIDEGNYIETVPKRGYRFTAEVEELFDDEETGVETRRLTGTTASEAGSSTSARAPLNSLAVLPLANESADPNVEYLSDGITESIISRLSRLSQLHVMARSTVFHYKGKTVAPQQVGRDLGVRAVLTGRVLQLGERLIVRTELVDATDGWQLWGGQYNRRPSDILELQETIAQDISENLQLKLTGTDQKRLSKRYTESADAYRLYIKARYYLNKRLTEAIQQATEYFQQAIDVDPSYAPAYVGLADAYPLLNLYGALTPYEAYPRAEAAALKALEIDDSFAEAHNSLGVVKLFYEWDWKGAESAFRRAIELKPGYPDAHQRYGMFLVTQGRFAEAVTELERAQELDPLSLITRTINGYPFYYGREFGRAAERFRQVIEMDRSYSMAHFRLGLTYAQEGMYEQAIAELRQSAELSGDRDTVAALGYVYGLAGRTPEARAALAELGAREKVGFVSSYDKALINVGLGDNEASIDWLEKAYEERSYWLIYLQVDPALEPLRANPRFVQLLNKVFGTLFQPPVHGAVNTRSRQPVEEDTSEGDAANVSVDGSASARVYERPEPATGKAVIDAAVRRESEPALAVSTKTPSGRWGGVLVWSLLALLGVGLIYAIVQFVRRAGRSEQQKVALPFQSVRLKRITDSGDIFDAAISPDGKSVAYCSNNNGVWMQNLATGSRLQLYPETEQEERRGLSFSPDGNQLYFYSGVKGRKKLQLMRVSVLGGQAQKVLEDFHTWTAIAPDGKRFAFVRWKVEQGEQSLIVSDGTNERTITTRKMPDYFELWGNTVAWSPDGQHIACVEWLKHNNTSVGSVLIVNAVNGTEMRLPNRGRNWYFLYDLTWLPGGDGLLVSAREDVSAPYQIWRASYPAGEWSKVTNDLNNYDKLSVSADSSRLVTVQASDFANLWLLPQGDLRRARQITFGNGRTDGWGGLSWTPDGKIVFTSNASGSPQIWITDAEGANPKQLTLTSAASSQPFVSPDGRHVVFTSSRDKKQHIWRMDIDGSNLVQLTDGGAESAPTVTPDGRYVLYTSATTPFGTTWRVPLAGDGKPSQLIEKYPTWFANASPDGKLLATSLYDADSQSPWRLGIFASTGGPPITSFDWPIIGLARWTPDNQSVIYLDQHYPYIWQQPIRGGERKKLLSLVRPERIYNFAFSPDNTQLLLARGRPQSDALLIEDVK